MKTDTLFIVLTIMLATIASSMWVLFMINSVSIECPLTANAIQILILVAQYIHYKRLKSCT